jgi:choline-sulfatase
MLTSTHCETHGVYANEGVWPGFTPLPELITWPEVFSASGYATGTFGKHHVPGSILKWDHCDVAGGGMKLFDPWLPPEDPSVIRCAGVNGGRYPSDAPFPAEDLTDAALAWMAEQEPPYVCRFGYLQPHTPVYPPAWAVAMVENDPGIDGDVEDAGDFCEYERRFARVIGLERRTPEEIRLTRVYYHALVTWVDSQVGRIMEWLDERGELDRTVVVVEADHGAALGEGGRYAKHVFAPEVHRTPRIIACPERLQRGQRRADICDSLDLGPTLLALAGVPPTEPVAAQFEGRDLFGASEPEAVFATIGQGHPHSKAFPNGDRGIWDAQSGWPRRTCVRSCQFRLDRNERINDMAPASAQRDIFLCDWRHDPHERRNLASDGRFTDVLRRLTALLDGHVSVAAKSSAPPNPWRKT